MAMDVGDVKSTFFAIMTYSELYLHCGLRLDAFFAGGSVNCHHIVALLRAEQVSVCCNDPVVVQREYDEAIKRAGKLGFKHNQALANEKAGVYFLEQKDEEWASIYLTRAWEIYGRWGARGKVRQMELKYGDYGDLVTPRASGIRVSVAFRGRPRLQYVAVKNGGPVSIFNIYFKYSSESLPASQQFPTVHILYLFHSPRIEDRL
jgi:hypothetical protein